MYEEVFWTPALQQVLATRRFRLVTGGGSVGGHHRACVIVPNALASAPLYESELAALVGGNMLW